MAFKYTIMGQLVASNPKAAHDLIAAVMTAHGNNQVEAAAHYAVNRDTFGRWLDALERSGFPVEGRGTAKRGRKPGAPKAEEPEPDEGAAPAPRGRVRRFAAAA